MPILDQIPFEIDVAALLKRMRMGPDGEYAGECRVMAQRAQPIARPKAIYDVLFVESRDADSVVLGNVRFTSRVLRQNLEKVERVFPFIATCGVELDGIPIASDDVLSQFCRDAIKEMALHAALSFLRDYLQEKFALVHVATMNPGSGDANVWPIEQQRELFSVFGDVRELIGVTLTDTCLMLPNKTVSGIFYPTEVDFVTCKLCHRKVCPNRRAPFDQELWHGKFGTE